MKQLLTAFLVILCVTLNAQKKDTVQFDPTSFEPEKKITLPFSAVQVIDARFDRSNIGSMHKKVKKNWAAYERVPAILPDSFHIILQKLIGNISNYADENDTLTILVKQFRIVEHLFNNQNQNYEPKLFVKVSASFFRSKNDSLFRIFSFDDLISVKWPYDRQPAKDVLQDFRNETFMDALQLLLKRKNWNNTSLAFSKKSLEEGMQKRFDLPLLMDTVFKTGIYKTFKEFKSNNPSIVDVKIKMKKGMPVEISDASGKPIYLRDYWGICAENKRFIFFREKIYELQPSDRSFRFRSYYMTDDLHGGIDFAESFISGAGYRGNDVSRQYFYLNMDEEQIYLEEIFGNSKGLKANQKDLLR